MRIPRWIVVFVIVLICLNVVFWGLFAYFKKFSGDFSDDQGVWGTFGDYVNPFLSLVNVVLLTWIGFITYRTTHNFNRLQVLPLLDFSVTTPTNFVSSVADSWYLINCSNAAARNIRLKFFIGSNFESKWIACYALNGNSSLELPWMRYASRVELIYCDTLEENYFHLDYQNLRGIPHAIRRRAYETILTNTTIVNSTDLVTNYNNHIQMRIKHSQPPLIDADDYINKFLIHHKFNV